MASADIAGLRRALARLRVEAPAGPGPTAAAALDWMEFLLVRAGIKPVQMLGRDDERTAGLLAVAAECGLETIEGSQWHTGRLGRLPDWLSEAVLARMSGVRRWHVCRDGATAREVAEICRTGVATVPQEARLLNYPRCCVRRHHGRGAAYLEALARTLGRDSGGDDALAARMFADGATVKPVSAKERRALRAVLDLKVLPFVGFVPCDACVRRGPASPAGERVREAGDLAAAVDGGLHEALAAGTGVPGGP